MLRITTRTLLGAVALAASTAVAGAQAPQDTTARRPTTSTGTVERDVDRATTRAATRAPRARRAASARGEPRAHPRDFVGADSGICDDLCRRERMMDSLYGKDRERLPRARRP